jgi:hypothetical protein
VKGQAPAPMKGGTNPEGAPVTVAVPVTVPGPVAQLPEPEAEPLPLEQHELFPELPEPLLHEDRLASRLASELRPMPEATWGTAVINRTSPAAAITPIRAPRRQRCIEYPLIAPSSATRAHQSNPRW